MMNETFYTNGKNQFKNDEFDGNEWSAPYMVDVNEIKDRIYGFNLVGRKIKDTLRHTFATRLCESGINVKVIQDVLGHADISTTMDIYVDVMDELKKREIASFDSYMAKSRETI